MVTAALETLLDEFRSYLERRDRSAHSIRAYLSDLRQFAAWFAEHAGEPFALKSVTEYDVRDWRDHLEKVMKPATVNRKLSALSVLYHWAGEQGWLERDPTQHVSGVDQQPTAPQALPDQALRRILRQAWLSGSKRDAALLELLAATGLRASEIAGLTMGDLDLGERHGWVTVRGKGRKQRRVPVHKKARRMLQEYLDERGELTPNAPLFLTQQGTALTPYVVWYTVKKYARLAEVENVKPHSFRHTVATRLVRDPEVDLVTAATFLGHSRLDTTARYSQPSEEDLAEAAERLER
ncbi:MAG: tyrosine-type recombinase/integrase [Chloroflexi bacterium]|nr:tyrosine-type recombinase/integrase [Chloroflexota bacterium]MBU1746824.1 tyrosine-type recombinase/integrase [Chloroflexota bacterium]